MTPNAQIGLLNLTQSTGADGLLLTLSGTADLRDSKELTAHLVGTHQDALDAHSTKVMVDVQAVEFMNSTALSAFVTWVAQLQKTAVEKRYRIVFRGNNQRRWQRGSLHALASFAPEHISVELA